MRIKADLVDINVWLALLVPEHPFHPRALSYWKSGALPGLNRVVALGLLRLLTNPKAMGGQPLGLGEAWAVYQNLLLSGVVFLDEPQGLERVLARLVEEGFPVGLWTDAYLAAFALVGGYRLVTLDRDFLRFGGLGLSLHLLETGF